MTSSSGRRLRSTVLWLLTVPIAGPLVARAALPATGIGAYHAGGSGYLGVDVRGLNDPQALGLKLHETHGIVVIAMDHDSPGWAAGIRERDVIYSVNGITIDNEEQFRKLMREMQPGRAVSLVLSRDGAQQTLNATLADRSEIGKSAWEKHWVVPAPVDLPDDTAANASGKAAPGPAPRFGQGFLSGHLLPYSTSARYTGLMLDVVTPQLANYFGIKDGNGLLVHSVESNSPAAQAGMQAGDVVLRVNGETMRRRSDWTKALRNGKGSTLVLTVMRDHHEQSISVMPDTKKRSSLEGIPEPKPRWVAVLLPW